MKQEEMTAEDPTQQEGTTQQSNVVGESNAIEEMTQHEEQAMRQKKRHSKMKRHNMEKRHSREARGCADTTEGMHQRRPKKGIYFLGSDRVEFKLLRKKRCRFGLKFGNNDCAPSTRTRRTTHEAHIGACLGSSGVRLALRRAFNNYGTIYMTKAKIGRTTTLRWPC